MNWQVLKYFEVVAQEQHITRAANRLFITPSGLSRAISKLEEELAVPLFERSGRNIILTPYGEKLEEYVKSATALLNEGVSEVVGMYKNQAKEINISSIFTYAATELCTHISTFQEIESNIRFNVYQNATYDTLNMVLKREVDIGFASDYIDKEQYSMLTFAPVMQEEIILITSDRNPLARKKQVSLEELENEAFVSFYEKSGIYPYIENSFQEIGMAYRPTAWATDDYTIASMVRSNMGIAFMPYGKSVDKKGLTILRIKGRNLYRLVYMVWRKERFLPESIQHFIKHVNTCSQIIDF